LLICIHQRDVINAELNSLKGTDVGKWILDLTNWHHRAKTGKLYAKAETHIHVCVSAILIFLEPQRTQLVKTGRLFQIPHIIASEIDMLP
jgi:hypothetical protein